MSILARGMSCSRNDVILSSSCAPPEGRKARIGHIALLGPTEMVGQGPRPGCRRIVDVGRALGQARLRALLWFDAVHDQSARRPVGGGSVSSEWPVYTDRV